MTKNIIVVDAQGKKHGTTYLKRAKGLVKQGRARFLSQTMLCLACPPNQYLEDNIMSEQTIENNTFEQLSQQNTIDETIITQQNTDETIPNKTPAEDPMAEDKYSIAYCLSQIEQIANQTAYLNQALSELQHLESDPFCGQKATAISDVVKSRETTNQQLLGFYNKMYDDLKAPVSVDAVSHKARLQEQLLKIMEKTLENNDYPVKEVTDLFNGALDGIRHINE